MNIWQTARQISSPRSIKPSILWHWHDFLCLSAVVVAVFDVLKLCDQVRDDTLPTLGVRLEDHDDRATAIKLVDREVLLREREEKLQQEELKRKKKDQIKKEQEAAKVMTNYNYKA